MPTTIGEETLHFRCAWHAVEGHFLHRQHGFPAKCEVIGCENRAMAYWYRGSQFVKLPDPKSETYG